ncbi:MAG: fibronectin type III domain-containing protein, partial [Candidatus Hodarchaeales archaeon]
MNLKKLCLILMTIILVSSLSSIDVQSNPAGTNIIITEVLYDTPGTDSDEEWLELYNPTDSAISLIGWTLTDNAGSFTLSGTVPANGYFIIARVAAGFNALYGFDPDLSGMSLYLGNTGDQLILKDNNGVEVDFVAWEGYVTGWDVSAYHTTIYRPSETDTDTVADWSDSGTTGDPGTGPYGGGGGDTTPPIVSITTPANGAMVNGTITITFEATDSSGIDNYELYIDSSLKATTTSYVWNTTLETEGSHQILAKARDTVGNWGEDTVTVTVDNIATPAGAVKIMTFNIKESGEDPTYPDWKAVVQEENADIIMFVETGTWDDNSNAKLDQYVSEFNSYFTGEDPYDGYCTQGITYSTSGEAIMSRYPVLSTNQIATVNLDNGTIYDVTHDFFDSIVNIGDYDVHIIGAHLKAIPGATNEQRREWEMEGIINYLDDLGNVPIIYLGDLNSFSPEDWGLNTLQSGLGYGPLSMIVPPYTNPETSVDYSQYAPVNQNYTDVFRTLNPTDLGISNPAYDSRIDFVWVNQLLSDKIIESTTGDTASALTGSDHLTVDVTIDFGTVNDTTPPAQVTGLTATAVSGSQIDLTWNANSEADLSYYTIYREGLYLTTTTTNSYSDTGLSESTTYSYEVSATDTSGNEGLKSIAASATTIDETAPSQVTGLSATAISGSQIDLTWNANSETDLDHYNVYRDSVLIGTTTSTSYSDTGLADGTTYVYEVSAVDLTGNEGLKSASASATTFDTTPPAQVTGLTASAASSSQIDLVWNANSESDLDYYNIYRDGVLIATATSTSYSDTGLTSETTYTYQVSAVDLSGNEGLKSTTVSATTFDVTPPALVTGLTASAISASQIDLTWNANSETDLDYYNVYRDGVLIATTVGTSYSDTGLADGTTYVYEVSAIDTSGNEGLKSVSASATTFDITPPAQVTGLTAVAVSGSQIDLAWNANSESDL